MKPIQHSKPWLTAEDIALLEQVLHSGMIGQGGKTREFELALSEWVHAAGGVAVGSGTAALVLAMLGLGIGQDDEVIVPTYVCTSVLEAVLTVAATPVICDVGPDWVMTPEGARCRITSRTKAVIVPHMYGIFADTASFAELGIPVIEDCAQAVEARHKRNIGGKIAIFSFHPTKCLTTGEGGMAVSSDESLVATMRGIRDGRRSTDHARLCSPLSDMAAALGLSQLSRYGDALTRRKTLAENYRLALESLIPHAIPIESFQQSMHFRFPLKIAGGVSKYQADFQENNIYIRKGVDQMLHRLCRLPDTDFPQALELFNTTVSLPLYPALTDDEFNYCAKTAVEIFGGV